MGITPGDKPTRLGYPDYQAYLDSDPWNDLVGRYRRSKLPQRCIVCGDAEFVLVHRTMARLGAELLTDVVPLCPQCHGRVTATWTAAGQPKTALHAVVRKAFGLKRERVRKIFAPFVDLENNGKSVVLPEDD